MQASELIRRRLVNQHLVNGTWNTPVEVVATQGAVQAQDFTGALWGIGVRLPKTTEQAVERDFTAGRILRLHILRPTWHFVTPADIRWMLKLSAPRVHAFSAGQYRQHGIDAATVKRTFKIIEKALRGGNMLTRNELGEHLDKGGVRVGKGDGVRLAHLMFHAELESLVASGPRRGKQFTYALLDERAPDPGRQLRGQDALAELTRRYISTRGPATARDFAWWSGLRISEARAGLKLLDSELEQEGEYYWPTGRPLAASVRSAFLMPNYDEYGIGFVDRSAIYDPEEAQALVVRNRPIFAHILMVDGRAVGTWKREVKKDRVEVAYSFYKPPRSAAKAGIARAAKRYADFLQLKLVVLSS
jgi:hypothetical protein